MACEEKVVTIKKIISSSTVSFFAAKEELAKSHCEKGKVELENTNTCNHILQNLLCQDKYFCALPAIYFLQVVVHCVWQLVQFKLQRKWLYFLACLLGVDVPFSIHFSQDSPRNMRYTTHSDYRQVKYLTWFR